MLKDDKNTIYQGRINFVLASIAIDENDIPGAITYLEESVATVGDDKFQEIESQYLLATLYMKQMQYIEAEEAFKSVTAIKHDPIGVFICPSPAAPTSPVCAGHAAYLIEDNLSMKHASIVTSH